MAMESLTLREALIALAAGHLALTDPSYKVLALEARSKALRSLANHVVVSNGDMKHSEASVAACLTFVIDDVGIATGEDWKHHMNAAAQLITATQVSSHGQVLKGTDAFKTTAEGRWILRNFAYHDILASISSQRRPLFDGSYLIDIADEVDSYTGVATDLLVLVAEIRRIEEEAQLEQHLPLKTRCLNGPRFFDDCSDLEQRLHDWKCQDGTPAELSAVACAYRCAILIVLYRMMRNQLCSSQNASMNDTSHLRAYMDDKCRNQVAEILDHISRIPVGSTGESPLLFPLFLAGGEALEPSEMAVVRLRLQELYGRRRFRNVSRATTILEDLWHRRLSGEPDLDWANLTDFSGEELLLT